MSTFSFPTTPPLVSVPSYTASLGTHAPSVEKRLRQMRRQQFARRFWSKDPTLWKKSKQEVAAIANRLGWLSVLEPMRQDCSMIRAFAEQVRAAGFTHALLLGMGGSSLCTEVCRQSLGVAPGFLDLAVLDSTDPEAVLRAERRAPLEKTLFLVSTKSGTTTETLSFFHYFYEKLRRRTGARAGANWVAITDPGTPLVRLAAEKSFRRVFLNPPDIGGRFSALSYFGLVPAALLGADIGEMLRRASQLSPKQAPQMEAEGHPAIHLGVALGELGLQGRNKVTFFLSPGICSFGAWVEQLIAESTGKEGKGLLPVVGEPPGAPEHYGPDRAFVELRLSSSQDREARRRVAALDKAGFPIFRIGLRDPLDLGAEFFRWEIATSVAASLWKVNPFDEPNVQESKDNTTRLLRAVSAEGKLPEPAPLWQAPGIRLFGGSRAKAFLKRWKQEKKGAGLRMGELLSEFCRQVPPDGYVALLAYCAPSPKRERWLQQLRQSLRNSLRVATTLGYGPRYLHSTGQFHKGGPPNGLFVQITREDPTALPIPGQPYGFRVLKQAQARGDLEALIARQYPVLRLHLEGNPDTELRRLASRLGKRNS